MVCHRPFKIYLQTSENSPEPDKICLTYVVRSVVVDAFTSGLVTNIDVQGTFIDVQTSFLVFCQDVTQRTLTAKEGTTDSHNVEKFYILHAYLERLKKNEQKQRNNF